MATVGQSIHTGIFAVLAALTSACHNCSNSHSPICAALTLGPAHALAAQGMGVGGVP